MSTALKEWPLWEVFVRSKQGLEHKHCGSLHASDAPHALLWVVPSNSITASEPDSKDSFFDPAADKVYRHPTFYEIPDKVGHM